MSTVLPQPLGLLISNQPVDFQNLAYELYKLIAASAGDVTGPAVAVNLNIAVFDGVTGKLIKDGGQTIAQAIAAAVAASGDVDGPAGAVANDVVVFDGVTGKLVKDTGILSTGLVLGPASATANNLAVFDGTTGKLIKDGGAVPAGLVQYGETKLSSGSVSSNSVTFVNVTGVTVSLTTGAHRVIITLVMTCFNSGGTGTEFFDIAIDGVRQGGSDGIMSTSGAINTVLNGCFTYTSGVLSAAAHTFQLMMRVGSGTGVVVASTNQPCWIQAIETAFT